MITLNIINPPDGMNSHQEFESEQDLLEWLKTQNETGKFDNAIWDGVSLKSNDLEIAIKI